MAVTKGFTTTKVHDLVKKGYTKAHLSNEKKKKFKRMKLESGVKMSQSAPPGLEMGETGNTDEEQV